ncbi:hypothetical protein SO802_007090 [Lithocarpus litseifolius]|uniref:Uncharacterized protein n=1 Tax=Lithocarpus litseifolius TaxID=425828 RepID=A0AAW2DN21_9ROSI
MPSPSRLSSPIFPSFFVLHPSHADDVIQPKLGHYLDRRRHDETKTDDTEATNGVEYARRNGEEMWIGKASPTQLQSILQACSGPSVLQQGRQVHAKVIVSGYTYSNNNGLLGAKLLGMYVLCGSFVDAKNVFYKLELRVGHGINELWLYSCGACFKVSIGKPNYSELICNATPSDKLLGILILPSLGL